MSCAPTPRPARLARRSCLSLCVLAACAFPLRAQEAPLHTIDEDVTAFAFAPDGRIVFSVRHPFSVKIKTGAKSSDTYDVQRDDIWIRDSGGRTRKIIQGDRLSFNNPLFSYSVNGFAFSPNGRLILAETDAVFMLDPEAGTQREAGMAMLFDENGKEIRIANQKDVFFEATAGGWLADGATVVYFTETVKPRILYGFHSTRYNTGHSESLFAGRTFLAAAWLTKTDEAIAVERDRNLTGPPRLQRLQLVTEIDTELTELDGFGGGLSVSPSGTKAAYFVDHEVLEFRDLAAPSRVARVRVGIGSYHWAPDEKRVLLKRASEKKSGDLVWVDIPPLAEAPTGGTAIPVSQPDLAPLFHGLTIRDFRISPDGRFLAVITVGKHNLILYPLSAR